MLDPWKRKAGRGSWDKWETKLGRAWRGGCTPDPTSHLMCAHICTYVCTHTHTCMYTHARTHAHTRTHTHAHMHVHTRTHVHTHPRTQTRTTELGRLQAKARGLPSTSTCFTDRANKTPCFWTQSQDSMEDLGTLWAQAGEGPPELRQALTSSHPSASNT